MNESISLVAVLAAGVAQMVVGAIWYSKKAFGKQWTHLMGLTQEKMEEQKAKGMGKALGLMFVFALVSSYVLAYLSGVVGVTSASAGLQLGFVVWLGFSVTVSVSDALFGQKPWKLVFINMGNSLVSLAVAGIIIGAWR